MKISNFTLIHVSPGFYFLDYPNILMTHHEFSNCFFFKLTFNEVNKHITFIWMLNLVSDTLVEWDKWPATLKPSPIQPKFQGLTFNYLKSAKIIGILPFSTGNSDKITFTKIILFLL